MFWHCGCEKVATANEWFTWFSVASSIIWISKIKTSVSAFNEDVEALRCEPVKSLHVNSYHKCQRRGRSYFHKQTSHRLEWNVIWIICSRCEIVAVPHRGNVWHSCYLKSNKVFLNFICVQISLIYSHCIFSYHCAGYVCVCVFALQKDTAYCTACSKNEFLEAYKSCWMRWRAQARNDGGGGGAAEGEEGGCCTL